MAAAVALLVSGCETDEAGQDAERGSAPDAGREIDDEVAPTSVPATPFGPECDRILAEADEDAETLATYDTASALQRLTEFDELVALVQQAGLTVELTDVEQITVFAPLRGSLDADAEELDGEQPVDDDADAARDDEPATPDDPAATADDPTPEEDAAELEVDDLEEALGRHVITDQTLDAQQLTQAQGLVTIAGADLAVTAPEEQRLEVEVEGATAGVVCGNLQTQDGYVHVIDAPLAPLVRG